MVDVLVELGNWLVYVVEEASDGRPILLFCTCVVLKIWLFAAQFRQVL